jgi:hypothetical protein
MTGMLAAVGAWPLLVVVVLVYGFFPGVFARLISLCFHREDPRRKELINEVYYVPRWERPMWVAEQFERAISEGLWERVSWAVWDAIDGRFVNRWELGDGVARHLENPETFEVPSPEDIDLILPGDSVKLMFDLAGKRSFFKSGCQGERMWVKVTAVDNGHFVGELDNYPVVWNRLYAGDEIKFESRHIIDLDYRDDEDEEPSPQAIRGVPEGMPAES